MTKKNIYIGGNIYGAGNIGDDSILYGILRTLNLKDYRVTIGTYKGKRLENLDNQIEFIDAIKNKEVRRAIRQCDIFICGGGTLVGDELGIEFPLLYVAKLISYAKIYCKKVYILSIGANKLKTEKAKRIVKKIYTLADFISVRDVESSIVCKSLEINKLLISADPAFMLTPKETKRTGILKNQFHGQQAFGINVVNEAWANDNHYKKIIAEACSYISEKYNYKPIFFCTEIRPENIYDYYANKTTAKYLTCKYSLLDPTYFTPEEMIDLISSFKFIVAMRMHALIFASISQTPFVGISRIDKVDNFMNSFNLKCSGSIKNIQAKKLIDDIENIIAKENNLQKSFENKITDFQKRALLNSRIFEETNEKRSLSFSINPTSIYLAFLNVFLLPKRFFRKILLIIKR